MISLRFVLLLLALLCFAASAFGVPSSRVQLTPMGLALWVLSLLVP